jgi:mannose-6-phosphate isomerase
MQRAREVYILFRTCFYDPAHGVLREHYTQGLETDAVHGEVVEGGHHYEWVRLLGEFARANGDTLAPEAYTLYRFAADHTHEKTTGLIYRENRAEGQVHHAGKRAWAMAEAIKAAVTMAEHDGTPLDPRAHDYVDALFRHFLDRPCQGAWLDTLTPDNQPAVSTSAASNFYHMFTAFADYIRFSEQHLQTP